LGRYHEKEIIFSFLFYSRIFLFCVAYLKERDQAKPHHLSLPKDGSNIYQIMVWYIPLPSSGSWVFPEKQKNHPSCSFSYMPYSPYFFP